jgi:hypothetical protein
MLPPYIFTSTDVSQEFIASIFRLEEQAKQEISVKQAASLLSVRRFSFSENTERILINL